MGSWTEFFFIPRTWSVVYYVYFSNRMIRFIKYLSTAPFTGTVRLGGWRTESKGLLD